jgi:hypothetical protein
VIAAGDRLFTYIYLDSENLPTQIMLQFKLGNSWDHRAYWGASKLSWGVEGTNSRRYMGNLPDADRWVRLEIPANAVGLENSEINGIAFTLFDGRATWAHTGKFAAGPSPYRNHLDWETTCPPQLPPKLTTMPGTGSKDAT